MTYLLRTVQLPLVPLWLGVLAALLLSLELLPQPAAAAASAGQLPGAWDIPLRMAIATGFRAAHHLAGAGCRDHIWRACSRPFPSSPPRWLAFAQHQGGAAAAVSVLRGLLLGLFSFASFMFTLALLLAPSDRDRVCVGVTGRVRLPGHCPAAAAHGNSLEYGPSPSSGIDSPANSPAEIAPLLMIPGLDNAHIHACGAAALQLQFRGQFTRLAAA